MISVQSISNKNNCVICWNNSSNTFKNSCSKRGMNLKITIALIIATSAICTDGEINDEKVRAKRIIAPSKNASPNEHPWMVELSEPDPGLCGGSIITECYILTAAHCFGMPKEPLQKVTIGVHRRSSTGEERQEYFRWDKYKNTKTKFFKYFMHEDATALTNWMPDLALVRLSHPIKFIPNKAGVIHLSNKSPKEKLKVQAYGWGYTQTCKVGTLSDILQKKNEDFDECKAEDGQCSETSTNILGKGDSGGPWVSAGKDDSGALVDCQVGVSESCPDGNESRVMNIDFFIRNGWMGKKIKEIEELLKDDEKFKNCKAQTIKTCTPFNPPKAVDLVFVFDMSGSISVPSFKLSKEVAIKIYEGLVAKGYSVLASAITFHGRTRVRFYLNKYSPSTTNIPSPDIIKAINSIIMKPLKVGRRQTNTADVLNKIKKEMLGNGYRSYAPNFVILFYDGVLHPRSAAKRDEVIKMARDLEKRYHADILGVKLKNENGNDRMGAEDLKKIASEDPNVNDMYPNDGSNLDANNKDRVAGAVLNKISQ